MVMCKKNIFFFPIILLMFNGCAMAVVQQKRAFDSDKIIVRSEDTYTYEKRVGRSVNNKTDIQFEGFSGTDTILTINADSDDNVTIAYYSQIDRGDFKILLIDPDNRVTTIFNQSDSGATSFPIFPGISRLKMVGRESSGIISVQISEHRGIVYQK